MNAAAPGVWIPLNQLLALPLPAEPLASLWRELLRDLPAEASRERLALEQALQAHELRRLEARFDAGEIEAGFSLLDGLAPELEPELLAELLNRLMPGLQHALVELAGPNPATEVLKDPARADRLWLADQWMRRLEDLPGETSKRRAVIAEQLCRHGALAWMGHAGATSRRRALSLLQRLLHLNPKARNWVVPAIRERLHEDLRELEEGGALADPQHVSRLLETCAALGADPELPDQTRQTLELAVFRGRAGLEVWKRLEKLISSNS
ncbi:MAG: hypothetical protein NTZ23_06125 [Cyanobium sp. LacPavin_0920_WC12_MAG_63_22]|nr:hypothetical protein [Cyanobium sp. LacPavin_0920_WC12_MAG_63_22]